MKKSFSASLRLILAIIFIIANNIYLDAQTCSTFIKTFTDWVKQKPCLDEGCHTVGAKFSGVTIKDKNVDNYPWGFIYCAEGRMGLHGNDLQGRFTAVFSDRKASDGKRFDPKKPDLIDVTIYADGRVQIMLRSWGDAVFWLQDVRCSNDGFLSGIIREGTTRPSMITIALRKETMHPSRDGFRDWPN